jgi:hypothetical protein
MPSRRDSEEKGAKARRWACEGMKRRSVSKVESTKGDELREMGRVRHRGALSAM